MTSLQLRERANALAIELMVLTLATYTDDQLGKIYELTIGYNAMLECSRAEVIRILSEYAVECEALKYPKF